MPPSEWQHGYSKNRLSEKAGANSFADWPADLLRAKAATFLASIFDGIGSSLRDVSDGEE